MLRKKFFYLLLLLMVPLCASAYSLIPLPEKIEERGGTFVFPKVLTIHADSYEGDSIVDVLGAFCDRLTAVTGIKTKTAAEAKSALLMSVNKALAAEEYVLDITPKGITVEASRPAGFFYALQTLQQLLPSRAMMAEATDAQPAEMMLPTLKISDKPRFGWRGFMLDEGRHFYGKEEVKKILDVMAAYKMNRFHWHLTEDQGWRIEIKKYPMLTEVGAWRDSRGLAWGSLNPDGKRYGGYYTQDDAREIVQYAAERFIEIVPEIDIPGHSQAAVAAYPEMLACDTDQPHEVWLRQGVSDDVINVANPEAVQFAKDVIDEISDIFPYGYLHLGGDECPTIKWQNNAQCQARLKAIGSEKYRDLQTDFYRQLQQHIAAKPKAQQRKLIFWNEVMHGNTALLGSDITIMAWVGADAAAKEAATRGFNTILTPQIPYYINRRQSKLATEPRSQGWGKETLEAVYNYIPMNGIADNLQPRYIGVQANFWSEWVEDTSTVEYLMLPRLAAVAEAGWTQQSQRSYSDFVKRLQKESEYYRMKGLNYGKHAFK